MPLTSPPTTPEQALQYILDARAFVMHYGRMETGTPESGKLGAAYAFLAKHFGIAGQLGHVRPASNDEFTFHPKDASDGR